jgi:hypothetical protein
VLPGHVLAIINGADEGTYEILEVTSATVLTVDAVFVGSVGVIYETRETIHGYGKTSAGSSPTLAAIVAEINAGISGLATMSQTPGGRVAIISATSGVNADTQRASYLRVVDQPEIIVDGQSQVLLGLSSSAVRGRASAVEFTTDLDASGVVADMVAVFTSGFLLSGISSDIGAIVSPNIATLDSPVVASLVPTSVSIYTPGAYSYEVVVNQQSSMYFQALDDLLTTTAALRDLIGQAIADPRLKSKVITYLRKTVGTTESIQNGPVEILKSILELFNAPESQALTTAFETLRSRGFDRCADLLLLGNPSEAFVADNASYARALTASIENIGVA